MSLRYTAPRVKQLGSLDAILRASAGIGKGISNIGSTIRGYADRKTKEKTDEVANLISGAQTNEEISNIIAERGGFLDSKTLNDIASTRRNSLRGEEQLDIARANQLLSKERFAEDKSQFERNYKQGITESDRNYGLAVSNANFSNNLANQNFRLDYNAKKQAAIDKAVELLTTMDPSASQEKIDKVISNTGAGFDSNNLGVFGNIFLNGARKRDATTPTITPTITPTATPVASIGNPLIGSRTPQPGIAENVLTGAAPDQGTTQTATDDALSKLILGDPGANSPTTESDTTPLNDAEGALNAPGEGTSAQEPAPLGVEAQFTNDIADLSRAFNTTSINPKAMTAFNSMMAQHVDNVMMELGVDSSKDSDAIKISDEYSTRVFKGMPNGTELKKEFDKTSRAMRGYGPNETSLQIREKEIATENQGISDSLETANKMLADKDINFDDINKLVSGVSDMYGVPVERVYNLYKDNNSTLLGKAISKQVEPLTDTLHKLYDDFNKELAEKKVDDLLTIDENGKTVVDQDFKIAYFGTQKEYEKLIGIADNLRRDFGYTDDEIYKLIPEYNSVVKKKEKFDTAVKSLRDQAVEEVSTQRTANAANLNEAVTDSSLSGITKHLNKGGTEVPQEKVKDLVAELKNEYPILENRPGLVSEIIKQNVYVDDTIGPWNSLKMHNVDAKNSKLAPFLVVKINSFVNKNPAFQEILAHDGYQEMVDKAAGEVE